MLSAIHLRLSWSTKRKNNIDIEPPVPSLAQLKSKVKRAVTLSNPNTALDLYKVGKLLKRGSFGAVFLCKVKKTPHKRVVAKVSQTISCQKTFYQEVAMLRMFSHPNIVNMNEAFIAGSEMWIMFEFMDGGDLRRLCKLPGCWTEPLLAYVLRETLQAVEHLHRHHVVHRDIKPDNILWDRKGNVKLADLGIATWLTREKPMCEGNCGTQGYRAPEIMDRVKYDCKADIWSLAITTLELFEGERQTWDRLNGMVHAPSSLTYPSEDTFDNSTEEFEAFMFDSLEKDPAIRSTAKRLLTHPFLRSAASKKQFSEFAIRVQKCKIGWSLK